MRFSGSPGWRPLAGIAADAIGAEDRCRLEKSLVDVPVAG
jgi:hypothetical protein